MTDFYCPMCLSYRHEAPRCDHDITAPCPTCGKPNGGLTHLMSGRQCWRCDRAAGLPV